MVEKKRVVRVKGMVLRERVRRKDIFGWCGGMEIGLWDWLMGWLINCKEMAPSNTRFWWEMRVGQTSLCRSRAPH